MGLFSRKPKVSIEEFCREFYDTQIFHPIIAGTDVGSVFLETVFNSVVEADQSFAVIDKAVFQREMTALHMELFGLAWMHKFKRAEYAIPQSVFTKNYLKKERKLNIWKTMGVYNQAIAQSVTMTETGEFFDRGVSKQMNARRITQANLARANMFNKWAEALKLPDDPSATTEEQWIYLSALARVANRIGADIRRNDCILAKRLSARLAARLRCRKDLEFEALFRLGAVIFGLYEGAKEAIKSVNLQVSKLPRS